MKKVIDETASKTLISIVGRPNVGKSTLFNRLTGKRTAIVDDMPGVTRDRIYGRCRVGDKSFHIVDTGGLVSGKRKGEIEAAIEKQIRMSLESSAAVMFVVDAEAGLVPEDRYVGDFLRRTGKPVILVANKADNKSAEQNAMSDFHTLGLGEALPVSALQGKNVNELRGMLLRHVVSPEDSLESGSGALPVRFCLIGRPNVGKSSITNAILGEERSVVSPIPGTTRDRVDSEFTRDGIDYVIVDTAGMKRKKSKLDRIEFFSFTRTQRAIEESDVCVLVLDAEEGLSEGDKRIACMVNEAQRGLIIAVNKIDLIPPEIADYSVFIDALHDMAPFLRNMPVLFMSAAKEKGMDELLECITDVHARLNDLLPLELLKNLIYDIRSLYSPRSRGRAVGEIRDVIHDRAAPPRIVLKVNDTDLFPDEYMRLIENRVRGVFNLTGVPLEILLSADAKGKKGRKK